MPALRLDCFAWSDIFSCCLSYLPGSCTDPGRHGPDEARSLSRGRRRTGFALMNAPAVFPSSSAGGHMAVLIDSDVLDWYQTSRSHETKHMHYMDGVLVVAHKNHGCSEAHLKAEERRVYMFRMWSCHAHEFEGIYTSCRPNKSVMSTRQIQTSCE